MARKKLAKKKVAKKAGQARKKTASKKVSARAKAKPPEFVDLKTFFKGKRVVLAGRFTYYPMKAHAVEFFKSQKAIISKKLDEKTDILFVAGGRKPADQTKAEKLNASGDANISIVTNVTSCIPDFEALVTHYLADPKRIADLQPVIAEYWMYQGSLVDQAGSDFFKATIGPNRGEPIALEIGFDACSFEKAKLQNIELSGSNNRDIRESSFMETQFSNAIFHDVSKCDFQSVKGSLDIHWAGNCNVQNANLKELSLGYESKGTWRDCKIAILQGSGYDVSQDLNGTTFESFQIGKWLAENAQYGDTVWKKVTVGSAAIENKWIAKGCEFVDCNFNKLQVRAISFIGCTFKNCTFNNLKCEDLDLRDSKFTKCKFAKSKIENLMASESQLKGLTGAPKSARIISAATYPKLFALGNAILAAQDFNLNVDATTANGKKVKVIGWGPRFKYVDTKSQEHKCPAAEHHFYGDELGPFDVARGLLWVAEQAKVKEFAIDGIKTTVKKCPLKGKALKTAVVAALNEVVGVNMSDEEIKSAEKQASQSAAATKKAVKAELLAGDIKSLKKRSHNVLILASPFKKLVLDGVNLSGLNLSELEFRNCEFKNAKLNRTKFNNSNLRGSTFKDTDLSGADFAAADIRNVKMVDSNLSNAKLAGADIYQTVFQNSNLTRAKFAPAKNDYTFLDGIDFSTCDVTGANFDRCTYDQKTLFPSNFSADRLKKMDWSGKGKPPHERLVRKKATGKIDFETFMERLEQITDTSRLKKSMKMLKADSFQLFSEIKDDSVVGVVKSQSNQDLVYSCSLDSIGKFACCTQNLNACGGLRGAVCKHILVLVVGLAKGGQLDLNDMDKWIGESKLRSPDLDKEAMSEVLLKYKGAEAGEIDWRPTETLPEDFMAF